MALEPVWSDRRIDRSESVSETTPSRSQPAPTERILKSNQPPLTAPVGQPLAGAQVQVLPTGGKGKVVDYSEIIQKSAEPFAWGANITGAASVSAPLIKFGAPIMGGLSSAADMAVESRHLKQAQKTINDARAVVNDPKTAQHVTAYTDAIKDYRQQYSNYQDALKQFKDDHGIPAPQDGGRGRSRSIDDAAGSQKAPDLKELKTGMDAVDKKMDSLLALRTMREQLDAKRAALTGPAGELSARSDAIHNEEKATAAVPEHALGLTDAGGKFFGTFAGPLLGVLGVTAAAAAVTLTGGAIIGLAGAAAVGYAAYRYVKGRTDRQKIETAVGKAKSLSNAKILQNVAEHTKQQVDKNKKDTILSMVGGGLSTALAVGIIGAVAATGVGALALGVVGAAMGLGAAGVALGQFWMKQRAGKKIQEQKTDARDQIAKDRDPLNPTPLTPQERLDLAKNNPFYAIEMMRQSLSRPDASLTEDQKNEKAQIVDYLKGVGMKDDEIARLKVLAQSTSPDWEKDWEKASVMLEQHLLDK